METKPESQSIKTLIEDIDKKRIMLPEFQRDFVWETGKTFDLFDSLTREIFIGTIIYGVPSFEITVRTLDARPSSGQGSRAKLETHSYRKEDIERLKQTNGIHMILDGQQRITSIYRALKNIDKVWFISKADSNIEALKGSNNYSDLKIDDFLEAFSGREEEDQLSIPLHDIYQMLCGGLKRDNEKIAACKKTKYAAANFSQDLADKYFAIVEKFQDLLKKDKLLSYYLLDMDLEKFALFFERSNSKGIQLSFIDILAAKLYRGFNLRKEVEKFEDKYSSRKIELNKEIIVRTLAYLSIESKNIDKSSILKHLTPENFNEHWDNICELYVKSLEFLSKNHYILTQGWMPYENMIIPIIVFLREIGGDFSQMSEKQKDYFESWYWLSIFSERYTAATNEVIVQDANAFLSVAKDEKITAVSFFFKFKPQIERVEDIIEITTKASAVYKGVLNIINYSSKGLLDWKNTTLINFSDKVDDHHIFPKEYLINDNPELEDEKIIDSVANKTLIPKITNIKIGKKSPSAYMAELKLANPKFESSLATHLIPKELINGVYDKSFEPFLMIRAKEIFAIINSLVLSKSKSFVETYFDMSKKVMQKVVDIDIVDNEKIAIHATYKGKTVEASYCPGTGLVEYRGEMYSASRAAIKARFDIAGKQTSVNGWDFWRYTDANTGEETLLQALRKDGTSD